jgi:hypothetical protein
MISSSKPSGAVKVSGFNREDSASLGLPWSGPIQHPWLNTAAAYG